MENNPKRYFEFKVLESVKSKDGGFDITEKKHVMVSPVDKKGNVIDGKQAPKEVSVYPEEAKIMNDGVNGKRNAVAVKTFKYYEEVAKPKKVTKTEESKEQ